ncbi:uncharacterized protein LOC126371338 [Pectinophora gossypiella]|uniref:uncharacterized protein LOC126371338 n=1 Tax=Pectinophora gossypiella TaxID=13191 RepID=UPI00214F460C|nr:uncharacterized protein LOC126371338 [Pectinophora gossypiella]
MLVFLLSVMFIASGGGAQLGEADNCDPSELNICVELIPRKPVGLPKNREELDAHCAAYQTGMACMDLWIKRCLPTDGQKLVQQQIGGARVLMRFLCTNETAMRREFLKEPTCWARVSPDWSSCVNELQAAVHDIAERSQQLAYFNRNAELCCARDEFMSCVVHAGRTCSSAASTLLRRMAWVLAQDVAACTQQPRAFCAASPPPLTAPLLTAISGIILYPPRL